MAEGCSKTRLVLLKKITGNKELSETKNIYVKVVAFKKQGAAVKNKQTDTKQ